MTFINLKERLMNQKQHFFSKYHLVSSFNIPTILGSGTHSSVQLALHLKTQKYVAVKKIFRKLAIKQSFIHATLNHPNIVRFLQSFYDFQTQSTFVVLQYVSNGSLYDLITQNYCLSLGQIVQIFKGLCTGLSEIHKKFIIHRDIKPSNIMLGEHNQPKICDFGSATFQKRNLRQVNGTFQYLAPEILAQQAYSNKVDIWALGVTFYEVLEGKNPYKEKEPQQRLKQMSNDIEYREQKSGKFIQIIKKMLSINALNRPNEKEIIEFLNKVEIQNTGVNLTIKKGNSVKQQDERFDSQNSTFDQISEKESVGRQGENKITKDKKVEQKRFWQVKTDDKILCKKTLNYRHKNSGSQKTFLTKFMTAKSPEIFQTSITSQKPTVLSIKPFLLTRKA